MKNKHTRGGVSMKVSQWTLATLLPGFIGCKPSASMANENRGSLLKSEFGEETKLGGVICR